MLINTWTFVHAHSKFEGGWYLFAWGQSLLFEGGWSLFAWGQSLLFEAGLWHRSSLLGLSVSSYLLVRPSIRGSVRHANFGTFQISDENFKNNLEFYYIIHHSKNSSDIIRVGVNIQLLNFVILIFMGNRHIGKKFWHCFYILLSNSSL